MIYGCYGYSGELIAREAVARGLSPILAGRNKDKVHGLADELSLSSQVFDLDDVDVIASHIQDITVLIHAAGPFSATAKPMLAACVLAKVNYLDITGEMDVFALAQSMDAQFQKAGVVAMPGVGFDVIPTDCVAAKLKQLMPDASHLVLGFDSRSGMSKGTAKTSVEGLGNGGKVRVAGQLKKVGHAYKVRKINFGNGEKVATTIPWGDVNTAYYNTGIENIEVYIPTSPKMIKQMRFLNWIKPLFRLKPVQSLIKKKIEKSLVPPNQEKRDKSPTYVWGEVSNAHGQKVELTLKTANGYTVTKNGAVTVAEKLIWNEDKEIKGYQTPSMAFGADLVLELPGSSEFNVTI